MQGHLLTGALDGAVSVWQPMEHPAPGSVLDPTPVYSHPSDDRAPGGKEVVVYCNFLILLCLGLHAALEPRLGQLRMRALGLPAALSYFCSSFHQ